MIHVYKKATSEDKKYWKAKKGAKYLIKAINVKDSAKFKALGYSSTLERALKTKVVSDGDNEGTASKLSTEGSDKD